MEKIWYVEAIGAEKVTEEKLRKDFEIAKIKHNWDSSKVDFEEFKRLKHSWGEDLYYFDRWISSFHKTKEDAIEFATQNIGDINEAGAYNYVAVVGAPMDSTYYNTYIKYEDVLIYKYDRESDRYVQIDKTEEIFKPLHYAICGIAYTENLREEER